MICTSCLRSTGSGTHIAPLCPMAKDAGVDISLIAREAVQRENDAHTLVRAQEKTRSGGN